jgi:hypothetical protein
MRHSHSCPATDTAIQLGALMGVVGVGVMKMTEAAQEARRQCQEDIIFQSYADALERAKIHASEMEIVATHAVRRVTALEAECGRLRAACIQRQEVIEALMSGRA